MWSRKFVSSFAHKPSVFAKLLSWKFPLFKALYIDDMITNRAKHDYQTLFTFGNCIKNRATVKGRKIIPLKSHEI